jgi:hypothetical protein
MRENIVAAPVHTPQPSERPNELRRLSEVLKAVEMKRQSEVIRFRTCCADPRASK